jgi:hypothetical protein
MRWCSDGEHFPASGKTRPARPSEGLSSDLSLDSVRGLWSVACDGSSKEG